MKYLTWLRPLFYYLNHAKKEGRLEIVDSIHDIDFRGIKLWITDIENTIATRGSTQVSDKMYRTFQRANREGVKTLVLLTNKKFKPEKRSGDFWSMVGQLEGIFGYGNVWLQQPGQGWWPPQAFNKWPRKPWRASFRQAYDKSRNCYGYAPPPGQTLATGDKLRFDVLRPLRLGWNAALVNPLGSDGRGDRFVLIRPIERFTLRLWAWSEQPPSRRYRHEQRNHWATQVRRLP